MWPGKNLYIQVSQFDIQLNEDGKPIPLTDDAGNELTDSNGNKRYLPVTSPTPVVSASFTLANLHDPENPYDDVQVWSGKSDAKGLVTIPWSKVESLLSNTAIFKEKNVYLLEQTETGEGCVLPGGHWTLTVERGNAVSWETIAGETNLNRTLDIALPEEAVLGATFTLYNDREPKITFNANGGYLDRTTKGAPQTTKTEEIAFGKSETSVEYTIEENNPVSDTKFLNWATAEDPTNSYSAVRYYKKDDNITFYRQSDYDDLTLYAQWVSIVCKITDRDNNLLNIDGDPCIYTTLQDAFDDFNNNSLKFSGVPRKIKMLVSDYPLTEPLTLNRGKTAILTTASTDDSDGYPARAGVTTCTIRRAFRYVYRDLYDGEGNPILDTEGEQVRERVLDDKGNPLEPSMITNRFNLTLENITLDGNKSGADSEGNVFSYLNTNGGLVNTEGDYAMLIVSSGATLRNSSVAGYGGAIAAAERTTLEFSGGTVAGNEAGYGGAIYLSPDLFKADISGGAITDNTAAVSGGAIYVAGGTKATVSGGKMIGNDAEYGGAIYVEAKGTAVVTSGDIYGNTAANGAGVYLDWDNGYHAILYLSGNPYFGGTGVEDGKLVTWYQSGDMAGTEAGNFVTWGYEANAEKNGGNNYTNVRQDVYIAGTATPHSAIRVTGEIKSGDGTIWVWAEYLDHYEMLKQFAIFSGNGMNLSDAVKETTMHVFRNAWPDSETGCGGDYLTGQKGETANWIYWTGGFDVIFLKTDAYGGWKKDDDGNVISEGLPGATFTLYSDPECTIPFEMTFSGSKTAAEDGKRTTTISSDGTATYKDKNGATVTLEKGEVLLSKVPPKVFYLKETTPATGFKLEGETIYQVTISSTGDLTMKKKGTSVSYDTEVFKEKRREVTVNGVTNDLIQYVVINIPTIERMVILDKINNSNLALPDAEFELLRYDRSVVASGLSSGTAGAFFIGKLPLGTYYIHETNVPDGYDSTKTWWTLKVNPDGTYTFTGPEENEP